MWKQVPNYLEREPDLMLVLPRPLRLRSQDGQLFYWHEVQRPKPNDVPESDHELDQD